MNAAIGFGTCDMRFYVETRGSARSTGYRFLGAAPAQTWWRQRYGDRTAFEYPTILVERDGAQWGVYLGGIPSDRRDPSGSINRLTMVIESGPDPLPDSESEEDRELVLRLVRTWLGDIADSHEPGRLQSALDVIFTDEVVTRLYRGDPQGEVDPLARQVCRRLAPAVSDGTGKIAFPPSWIAPVRSSTAREAFIMRVHDLLSDDAVGAAVLVNLVNDEQSYARDNAEPETAVLVADPDRLLPEEPGQLNPKAPPPPPGPPVEPGPRIPGKAAAAALAAVLAIALIVVWWRTGRTPGGETIPPPPTPTPSLSQTPGP